MNETMTISMCPLDGLVAHPMNRPFPMKGDEWDALVESVAEMGVCVPLTVRKVGDKMQVLAGHRRLAAARKAGRTDVPVMLREMDDKDALAFVLMENLHRLGLSPADEACACAAMRDELEMDEEEISRRICRSVEWVRTRQRMLELGDEVMSAVRSADPERRLSIGSVEEILAVETDLRPQAVQMVLHPVFQATPLSPRQAREILREHLVEPSVRERAWNAGREALVKEYRKRLRERLGPEGADGMNVLACEWKDRQRVALGALPAEDHVPQVELTDEAPQGCLWLHLAVRHGLAVQIVPGADDGESRAMVSASLLRVAEAARREAGEPCWLAPQGTVVKAGSGADGAGSGEEGDGSGEDVETVTVMGMDHHAWVDLTPVRELLAWAVNAGDDEDSPEWAPEWTHGSRFYPEDVQAVCEWVMGMRNGNRAGEEPAATNERQ